MVPASDEAGEGTLEADGEADSGLSVTSAGADSAIPVLHVRHPKLIPDAALERLQRELRQSEGVEGFLQKGEDALLAVIDEFTGDLGVEAIREARRRKGSAVDKEDVLLADRRIRDSGKAAVQAALLTASGFFGGTAVALATAIVFAPDPLPWSWLWWVTVGAATLIAVGLFLYCLPRRR